MERLAYLFQQYIRQSCTETEKQELLELLRQEGTDEQVKRLMDEVWLSTDSSLRLKADRSDAIFQRVMQAEEQINPVLDVTRRRLPGWLKTAVIFILVVGGVGVLFLANRPSTTAKPPIDAQKAPVQDNIGYVAYIRNLTLPDGSGVVLRANSTLQYPKQFTGNTREVTLIGEAYFDIHHNADKPFIIHTGKVKTTVLGTAFNIKAYPGASEITVAVTRGKVKVEDETKVLAILTPEQQVVYDLNHASAKKLEINTTPIVDWTKQDMEFESASLQSIADVLSKRYSVTIRFANAALQQCPVTASFSGMESLETVLNYICVVRDAKYSIKDNVVILEGKGCE